MANTFGTRMTLMQTGGVPSHRGNSQQVRIRTTQLKARKKELPAITHLRASNIELKPSTFILEKVDLNRRDQDDDFIKKPNSIDV